MLSRELLVIFVLSLNHAAVPPFGRTDGRFEEADVWRHWCSSSREQNLNLAISGSPISSGLLTCGRVVAGSVPGWCCRRWRPVWGWYCTHPPPPLTWSRAGRWAGPVTADAWPPWFLTEWRPWWEWRAALGLTTISGDGPSLRMATRRTQTLSELAVTPSGGENITSSLLLLCCSTPARNNSEEQFRLSNPETNFAKLKVTVSEHLIEQQASSRMSLFPFFGELLKKIKWAHLDTPASPVCLRSTFYWHINNTLLLTKFILFRLLRNQKKMSEWCYKTTESLRRWSEIFLKLES